MSFLSRFKKTKPNKELDDMKALALSVIQLAQATNSIPLTRAGYDFLATLNSLERKARR